MSTEFRGPDPSEFFDWDLATQQFNDITMPPEGNNRALAVVERLSGLINDFIDHRLSEDGLPTIGSPGFGSNAQAVMRYCTLTELVISVNEAALTEVNNGQINTVDAVSDTQSIGINTYFRELYKPVFKETLEDIPLIDKDYVEELATRIQGELQQAREDVEAYVHYLQIGFTEPVLGIDY